METLWDPKKKGGLDLDNLEANNSALLCNWGWRWKVDGNKCGGLSLSSNTT